MSDGQVALRPPPATKLKDCLGLDPKLAQGVFHLLVTEMGRDQGDEEPGTEIVVDDQHPQRAFGTCDHIKLLLFVGVCDGGEKSQDSR